MNAILNAVRNSVGIEGAALYVTHPPCSDCAKHIANTGIVEVIVPPIDESLPRWQESMNKGKEILTRVGIYYYEIR